MGLCCVLLLIYRLGFGTVVVGDGLDWVWLVVMGGSVGGLDGWMDGE